MAVLLKWFVGFLIGSAIARVATLATVYMISDALLDSMLDEVWTLLGQYGPIAVLQLAGIGDALSVLASAWALKISIKAASIRPSSVILGGG